eukprot:gene3493-434_t
MADDAPAAVPAAEVAAAAAKPEAKEQDAQLPFWGLRDGANRWHFTQVSLGKTMKARCNHCPLESEPKEYAAANKSTSTARAHLHKAHADVLGKEKVKEEKEKEKVAKEAAALKASLARAIDPDGNLTQPVNTQDEK